MGQRNLRHAFAEVMQEIGAEHPESVVIVGDISHGIFGEFRTSYPSRYFNIGILEPAMIGIAAGMSKAGLKPVVHTIAPFLVERAFEQIKLDFGYQKLSASLVSVGGTYDYSQLGVSHHSYSDVSMMMQVETSSVFVPGSAEEFKLLFRENFDSPGIKYFRLTENPHELQLKLPAKLGHSSILVRKGNDVTLATTGPVLGLCAEVAERLKGEIDVEVLHFPTLKPFDGAGLLHSLRKTRKFVVVEELSEIGGLFGLVSNQVSLLPDVVGASLAIQGFVREYGHYSDMRQVAGLTVDNLVGKVRGLVASEMP